MTSTTRRIAVQTAPETGPKLRQTQAEYEATHPSSGPGAKPSMSSSKMYVCRRCQANFKTSEGRPDPRMAGIGKCNKCIKIGSTPDLAA